MSKILIIIALLTLSNLYTSFSFYQVTNIIKFSPTSTLDRFTSKVGMSKGSEEKAAKKKKQQAMV